MSRFCLENFTKKNKTLRDESLSMASLVIRPASTRDVPAIVEIRLGALTQEEISEFGVPEDNLCSSIEKLRGMWDRDNLLLDGFEVFVAENGGMVIGFIVFTMKGNDNIDNVIVAKEEQGKGVGRSLVEYVEDLAKSRGFLLLGLIQLRALMVFLGRRMISGEEWVMRILERGFLLNMGLRISP